MTEHYVAAPHQVRHWQVEQATGAPPLWSRVLARLDGDARHDADAVEAAIRHAWARHESLRTVLAPLADAALPALVVGDGQPLVARHALSEDGLQQLYRALTDGDARAHFGGAAIVTLPDATLAMILYVHAGVADAASLALLIDEIAAELAGDTPADMVQFSDVAGWLANAATPSADACAAPSAAAADSRVTAWHRLDCGADTSAPQELLTAWLALIGRFELDVPLQLDYLASVRTEVGQAAGAGPYHVPRTLELTAGSDSGYDGLRSLVQAALAAPVACSPALSPFGFLLESAPAPAQQRIAVQALDHPSGRYRLALEARQTPEGVVYRVRYDAARRDAAQADAIAAALSVLYRHAQGAPWTPLTALPLLAPGVTVPPLRGPAREGSATTLVALFEAAAAATPAAPAVLAGDTCWSYRDLDAAADHIAILLTAAVGHGAVVATCMPRSPLLVAAALGIMKAGAVFLPLDGRAPVERQRVVLDDAGVALVLLQADADVALDGIFQPTRLLRAEVPAVSPGRCGRAPGAADLAYILYTSGSTGTPKGVELTHRGLSNYVQFAVEHYRLADGRGALVQSPVTFDLTFTTLLAPLAAGQALILAPEEAAVASAAASIEFVRDQLLAGDITVLKTTPSYLRLLNALMSPHQLAGSVRAIVIGGEALYWADIACWLEHAPDTRLYNEYGPTETVVGCICADLTGSAAIDGEAPIGHAIDNTVVLVLDADGRALPSGAIGEIGIGGDGVGLGYRGRPELTARQFVSIVVDGAPLRVYRTGDRGRQSAGGGVDYLGRLDEQLKINGVRIEPGEIAAVLAGHPSVRQSLMLKLGGEGGQDRLLACVVAGEDATVAALQQLLEQQLPPLYRPHQLLVLPRFPLTPNGKIDRAALAAQAGTRAVAADPARARRAPRTPQEALLAEIVGRVLARPPVAIDDHFFDLGGDSIRSIALVSQAAEAGIRFSIADVFSQPTVRQLVALAAARPAASSQPDTQAVQPLAMLAEHDRQLLGDKVQDAYPLSTLQLAMIYHNERDPSAAIYHDVFSYHIRFAPDLAVLREAALQLVARHDALRTSFDLSSYSVPLQLVHAHGAELLEIVDIAQLTEAQQEAYVLQAFQQEKAHPFDIGQLPLLRLKLMVRDASSVQLLMSFHHAIIDGWSDVLLLTELFTLYHALLHGEALPPPPRTRYRDFIALERATLASAAARDYWLDTFDGMPQQAPRAAQRERRSVVVLPVAVPADASARLHALASAHSLPLKSFLLAVHLKVMALLSGSDEVSTAMVASGRPETADGDKVVGLFINSVPLRAALGDGSFVDLVRLAMRIEADLLPHRRFPLGEIKALLGRPELGESLFYFTHYHIAAGLRDLGIELLRLTPHEASSFPLVANFWLDPFSSQLHVSVAADADAYGEQQRQRIAGYYGRALARLLEAPLAPHRDAKLLGADELTLDRLPEPPLAVSTLDQRIGQQATLRPQRTALIDGAARLDFAGLELRVRLCAARLSAHGVRRGDRVLVCAPRSSELVLALIAVLRLGAVYVPVDPDHPAARLAAIVADAEPALIAGVADARHTFADMAAPWADLAALTGAQATAQDNHNDSWPAADGADPAYLFYTSGSTGEPKGVLVSHRAFASFADAMAPKLLGADGEPGVWLALTSPTFDISLLELVWTLAHGFTVVLQGPTSSFLAAPAPAPSSTDFSLFFFASVGGAQAYQLLLQSARRADQLGFKAVWTPERHFHAFGGAYANPALTAAALSGVTQRLQLRAGSLVLPLHHPVRAAEDWAMVDQLSAGRAGIAIASGWHEEDFVLAPHAYHQRKQLTQDGIAQMRQLWRGERVALQGPDGMHEVGIMPRPLRGELPLWLSAAGAPATFEAAGRMGTGILTHLLSQDLATLAQNIQRYRALAGANAHVVLMVHAYVDDTDAAARARAAGPFRDYLLSSVDLVRDSLGEAAAGAAQADIDAIIERGVERYLAQASMIGSVQSCIAQAQAWRAIGVDEIACLVDFGLEDDDVLAGIERLEQVRLGLDRELAAASVYDQIVRHGVTHLQCTPTVLRELIDDARAPAALAQLDTLLVGGENLPDWLARRAQSVGVKRLLNMYGPTEATIWCAAEQIGDGAVTLGRALDNSALLVLDAHGRPAPFDAPGELYIGGPCLADGYWRRPELTAAAFAPVVLPGYSEPQRLYRTGDAVLRQADGRIRFLGRLDRQVKLGGQRIELGEIEQCARALPGVADCVALAHAAGHVELAVVAAAADETDTTDTAGLAARVLSQLRSRLTAAMVPHKLVLLASLPKTRSGKLDQRALAALMAAGGAQAAAPVPPATAVELRIADLWRQTLGTAPDSVHQDFFLSGGNSLRAMVMVGQLRRHFQLPISVRQLFEMPTVAALAGVVGELAGDVVVDTTQQHTAGEWPLSIWQERLWMIDRIAPGKAAYNDQVMMRIDGEFDPLRARAALDCIVSRHDSLRTTFEHREGVPYAVCHEHGSYQFETYDFSEPRHDDAPPGDALSAAMQRARAIAERPFDLAQGPLLRVMTGRLDRRCGVLLLVAHHIVSDGWSLALMLREFVALYADPAALPVAPPSYASLALRERQAADGDRQRQLSAFWRRQLADLPPPLELPLDFRRPAIETFAGRVEQIRLPAALVGRLASLAHSQRATLFMVLLATVAISLKRMTGRDDILIGTDVANRGAPGAEDVIGLFVNQIVLRLDLSSEPGFATLLKQVREVALDAYEHQDHPFNVLVEELSPQRDLGRNPLYQVAFSLQEAPDFSHQAGDWRMTPLALELEVARLDLEINARSDPDGMLVEARYNSALYRPEMIARLLRGYLSLLEAVAATPAASIETLPFFDADQRRLLLEDYNCSAVDYPADSMLSLLRRHAAAAPDAQALTDGDGTLSYAELLAAVERGASGLRQAGVGPGRIVAVLAQRDRELVLALLSLWRVGAVYLPLDPGQPAARTATMLAEAGCTLVLHGAAQQALAQRITTEGTAGARSLALAPLRQAAPACAPAQDEATPQQAAYVLFTSGSTGVPKGALVLHRGMMNHLQAKIADLGLSAADVCAQTAPQTFDISIWQMLAPLAVGARLLMVDDDVAQTPFALCELIRAAGVTVVELVPTLLEIVLATVDDRPDALGPLRWMISTGEALPVVLCRKWFERFPAIPLMNAYGPTECSDDVTHSILRQAPDASEVHVPIGRAIGNVRLYVVDAALRLAPLGAAGELLVGGICVGGGYVNNPGATAAAFVANPFEPDSPYLAYRTGDLVRWRADGQLDYLGRMDGQVKLGGCRIELGEIEAVLDSDALVRRSVVTLSEHQLSGKRLCAYVIPDWKAIAALLAEQEKQRRTAEWQAIYDYYYSTAAAGGDDPAFDTRGWNDSYTRAPFPPEEMRIWRDQALDKIRALRPQRILEIGCGTGMLLFSLAAECRAYAGIDLSPEVVGRLSGRLASHHPHWAHVSVTAGDAHDLGGFGDASFDLVIINSVAQYFPGADYLRTTLELAAGKLAPGGHIFLGDLRALELQPGFLADVQLATLDDGASAQQLRAGLRRALEAENELCLAAGYLDSIARDGLAGRGAGVMHWLKRGTPRNELFNFRFDAAIRLEPPAPAPHVLRAWSEALAAEGQLERELAAAGGAALMVGAIPNPRLADAAALQALLDQPVTVAVLREQVRAAAAVSAGAGILPDQLAARAAALGYRMQSRVCAADPYRYEALLHRDEAVWPLAPAPSGPAALANNPLRARSSALLGERLQQRLAAQLPGFMVPQVVVMLDSFPTTVSGKIARSALPPPVELLVADELAPRTSVEAILAEIWCELLGLPQIGIRANFFALGGDSILGIQMVARANRRGLRFSARQIFEHQTIAELAAVAGVAQQAAGQHDAPLTGAVPLAPIQSALFELAPSRPQHWNHALLAALVDGVAPSTVEAALVLLVNRHDALRLRYERQGGRWLQSYGPAVDAVPLPLGPAGEAAWAAFADQLNASLSLQQGPLFKCALRPAHGGVPAALLLVAHHLVIDGVSWRIVLDELAELLSGAAPAAARLGPKTASYRDWVERQIALAESHAAREHLGYWQEQIRGNGRALFAARPGTQPDPQAAAPQGGTAAVGEAICSRTLAAAGAALLGGELALHGATLEEVLLCALAGAIAEVYQRHDVVLLREWHGRDQFAELDLSATVGWCTAAYPLRLRIGRRAEPCEQITAVMRQARLTSGREASFGILRYLDPDPAVRAMLAAGDGAEVAFNYFGQVGVAGGAALSMLEGYAGRVRSPGDRGACPLELNILARGRQVEAHWTYDPSCIDANQLERLADGFEVALGVLTQALAQRDRPLLEAGALASSALEPQLLRAVMEELDQ